MLLHLDKNAFRVLLDNVQKRTNFRSDVLEKDYYVVCMLKELSAFQASGLRAYFRGGTALYKALKTTNRFSEDIDLSVDTRDCNRTQSDKRLEAATKKYVSLKRDADSILAYTHRSEIVAVYHYSPIADFDSEDALQRFGKVKIEATSFTISEPIEDMEVSSLLYDYATPYEQEILRERYGVSPFFVKTMTVERIFVDKLFAAEAYYRKASEKNRAFEAAKHIYDLVVLHTQPRIQALFKDSEKMRYLLDIRLEEERQRRDGIPNVYPIEFLFFDGVKDDKRIKAAYEQMQEQYVLQPEQRIDFSVATKALKEIEKQLKANHTWLMTSLSEKQ